MVLLDKGKERLPYLVSKLHHRTKALDKLERYDFSNLIQSILSEYPKESFIKLIEYLEEKKG